MTPTVTSATDGIFAAFQRRPIVAIGDNHGLAQEEDFYVALVRDKRFAEEVGNVVGPVRRKLPGTQEFDERPVREWIRLEMKRIE